MKDSSAKLNKVTSVDPLALTADKDQYIVSVDLRFDQRSDKRGHHFLYASQVYDTLFGIFGTFEGEENNGEFLIQKISLELVNFKGMVNVGFTDDLLQYGKAPQELALQPSQADSFYFFVQGTSLAHNKELTLETPIRVTKKGYLATFNRMLRPLPNYLAPMGAANGKPSQGLIFDSEFYYRNGVDISRQELRAGQYDPLSPEVMKLRNGQAVANPPDNGNNNEEKVSMPSLRCHESRVNFIY